MPRGAPQPAPLLLSSQALRPSRLEDFQRCYRTFPPRFFPRKPLDERKSPICPAAKAANDDLRRTAPRRRGSHSFPLCYYDATVMCGAAAATRRDVAFERAVARFIYAMSYADSAIFAADSCMMLRFSR